MTNEKELIAHFREMQTTFSRFYSTTLTKLNLTLPQYALLNELVHNGIMTMSQTSKKLHISKPAITNLVDRLEKSSYLNRTEHPKDRRIYLLKVKLKSIKVVRKIQSHILGIFFKTLSQFDAEDRKTVVRFYNSLSQQIAKALVRSKNSK